MSIYLNVGHRPELLQRKRHLESKVNIFYFDGCDVTQNSEVTELVANLAFGDKLLRIQKLQSIVANLAFGDKPLRIKVKIAHKINQPGRLKLLMQLQFKYVFC